MTSQDQTPTPGAETEAAPPLPAPPLPFARLLLASAALLWEGLGPALWLPLSLIAAALVAALLVPWGGVPGWLHAAALLFLFGAILLTARRGLRGLTLPTLDSALRRVERDSGLTHRPLSTLRDRPSDGDPLALALWRLHQDRALASMGRLRVAWPRSAVPSRDPYALRALVLLLLVAAGGARWGDWTPRLLAALSPRFDGGTATASVALDLWVTPPDYTGLPPVFLKTGTTAPTPATNGGAANGAATNSAAVTVPSGSVLMARVHGGETTVPALELADQTLPFDSVDATTFQLQRPLSPAPGAPAGASETRVTVRQGRQTLGSWSLRVVPDQPPQISHAAPPSAGERGALRLDYAARDDYGLAEVKARIRRVAEDGAATDGTTSNTTDQKDQSATLDLPLPLPGQRPKEARGGGFHDLTAHPWAGLPVTVRLIATDGAGQTGQSDAVPFTLPERSFTHPVARAIIDQRKALARNPQGAPKGVRVSVARALADISARPARYGQDLVAFLTLRSAIARLMLDRNSADTVPAVQALLWETALRIEDGGLSQAERDLREAERRLADALERTDVSDAELNRLMDELQAALDALMNAVEQRMMEAMRRGETMPTVPPDMADQMTDRNDLQQMLDRMRDLAQTGSRDAARKMLSDLQKMMENLQTGAMGQPGQANGQNDPWQMMQELQTLSQQQQRLLDQSFRQNQDALNQPQTMPGQQGPRGRQPSGRNSPSGSGQPPGGSAHNGQTPNSMADRPSMQRQAEEQEALRRQLGDLMRRMGEQAGGDIPRPLGRAERAMRDATQALQQGSPGAAVPSQTQAMDEIQQGLQSMAEKLANQMMRQGSPAMAGQGQSQPRPGRGRDPLGRRPAGMGQQDGNDVKIPEQAEVQRAREILDELRRRAGQYSRPQPERDYIDRLLKRF